MLLALKKNSNANKKLDSIDPFQSTQWKNFGVKLVKSIKMEKYHTLYEDKSYNVLPDLLEKKQIYDFIFIDGWHTFDYTLLDFFYSDLILKVGGIIVIDDAFHQGVNKCLKYIDSNYKHYKRIQSPSTVGAYQKISDDNRSWDYHINF
jgi:predicted O-methyltransferase YrrM